MASSLDELQPNDYFQTEMEEFLDRYRKIKNISLEKVFVLNQFIEFVCFQKNLGGFDQIKTETIEEFHSTLRLLLPDESKENIDLILSDYFLFIQSSGKELAGFLTKK